MLAASTVPDLADLKYPVIASPKLDGIRCLIIGGLPYSRNMKLIPNLHVRNMLTSLPLDNLDGELMIDGDFNNVQSAIMSESGKPNFYFNVFDDFSNPKEPFYIRERQAVKRVLAITSPYVKAVVQSYAKHPVQVQHVWDKWLDLGYEGAIVRDPNGPYKFGRSTLKQGWMLKLKKFDDDEATIIGFEELMHNDNKAEVGELGQTKRSHHQDNMVPGNTLGAFLCSWQGVEFKLGTGFNAAQRKDYWHRRGDLLGSLAKFKYQGVGPNGKPRFPVFLGFRSKDDL